MKIEDFSPPIQRFLRFIYRLEARLEKRARGRVRGSGMPGVQFTELPADPNHLKLDWGMGRSSINPVVRQNDPGWNDQFGA